MLYRVYRNAVDEKQKNTANKFGGIIDTYPISEAVEDGAIVPILYEGRLAVQDVNRKVLDKSVDMVMEDLEEYQRADLKKKMSRAGLITKTEQNIDQIAFDISKHFQSNWGKIKLEYIQVSEEWWFVQTN